MSIVIYIRKPTSCTLLQSDVDSTSGYWDITDIKLCGVIPKTSNSTRERRSASQNIPSAERMTQYFNLYLRYQIMES